MDKIDISTAIAKISQDAMDDYMRQIALAHCGKIPRDNPFCDKAGKCIMRGWINVFWRQMASCN